MSGFDNWNPNYVPYVPPAQGGNKGHKTRKARPHKGKDPEIAKRRAARKALIAQHKAERAARKAERQRIAAARKAATIAKRKQAAIRRAERKRIAEQKRLERAQEAQIRRQRINERRELQQQKRQLTLEHKIEREKARRIEQERREARKELTELRKKTMSGSDTQYRVSIVDVNNDLPYIEDTEATRLWGIPDGLGGTLPLDGEAIFDDISDAEVLLKQGKARLAQVSKPQVTYEADVVSLGKTGFSSDAVGIGDAVQIVDTAFASPIRVEGRVLKIEEDLLGSPDGTRVTLGSIQETLSQRRQAERQRLDALIAQSSEWNTAASASGIYVRDLIGRMNEILNARGGYTYFTPNEGIFVYDKGEDAHPTNAIQIGGGFWRVADSLKPNGDWDWKNVCDGHGLFANRIYTGILSDAAGRNFWNLDTGEFSLQAAVKIGGQTVKQIVDDSAERVMDRMDEALTQRAIFDKLTNGGETQGIYLSGGHVYLNASYLRSGYIDADMIQTGSLNADLIKTGSLNADLIKTGRIQDYENSNWWDLRASTIHVASGEIGGMTITNNAIYNGALKLDDSGMHFSSGYGSSLGSIGWRSDHSGARMLAFEAAGWDTCLGWWSNGWLRMQLSNEGSNGGDCGFTIWGNLSLTGRSLTNAVIDSSCRVSGGGVYMPVQQFYLPTEINQQGVVMQWQPVRFGFSHGFVTTEDWGY